jgi:nitroimidazol reductase NimA-like FMN-containing flavoprotein (pyridoxamine 5'-phosphate oxidase superfamily)
MRQTDNSTVHDAGDVGRRIRERQTELNLSIDEVAERSGVAVDYLAYLEHTPIAEPSSSALLRLALALETSVPVLLGGGQGRPNGWANAAQRPNLIKIEETECQELLARGGVGRLVFRAGDRPIAFPVNFKMFNHDVVFRSEEGSEVSAIASDALVSFEVDRIDDAMSEGWSVLASGALQPVRVTDQLEKVIALGIEPWAGGERWTYFRLVVTGLSGRRIVAGP